ncbi:MAG: Gldg family protein [Chromatiaceae bacterium]|jgi:hypothetical protein
MLRRPLFWLLLLACVVLAARIAERGTWQFDATSQLRHSLSQAAQQALDQIGPGLDIVAFLPDYPISRAELEQQLAPYLAHPASPVLRYVDPLEQPDQATAMGMQRAGEIHLRSGDRREILTGFVPTAFDQALNRLALQGDRWIVQLVSAAPRGIDSSPLGISTLAKRAEQLGYRLLNLDPRRLDRLPDNTAVVLLVAPEVPLDNHTSAMLEAYLTRGGRLLWLAGGKEQGWAADYLAVTHHPGVIVDADAARFGLDTPANAIVEEWPEALLPFAPSAPAVLYRASALQHAAGTPWAVVGELRSGMRSWNETGPLTGRLRRDPDQGELSGPLTVGLALETREAPTARVLYLGSSHVFSNAQIGRLGNSELALGLLRWLTDNATLTALPDTPSHVIRWSRRVAATLGILLIGLLPIAYLAFGLWWRRRRRRQ